jgi:hypothetical protein
MFLDLSKLKPLVLEILALYLCDLEMCMFILPKEKFILFLYVVISILPCIKYLKKSARYHTYCFFKDNERCIEFYRRKIKMAGTMPSGLTRYKHNATRPTMQPSNQTKKDLLALSPATNGEEASYRAPRQRHD